MARSRIPTVLFACLALVAGCVGGPSESTVRPADRTIDYLAGLRADVYLPRDGGNTSAPVVVLVPGGGWRTADRTGLRPLASWLASRGVPAVAATYRAADDGVRLPRSVADIRCAAAAAAEATSTDASGLRPVVLLGHSSGAHLAAVSVLAPPGVLPRCGHPAARFVGLVGLAGPYDLSAVAELAEPLLGAPLAADPAAWQAADPLLLAGHPPPGLAVLLMHGAEDQLVPPRHTAELARVLRGGGTDVTLHMLAGADHDTVYTPRVAGPPLLRWLSHEEWR